jgi:hypothetical protein
MPVVTPPVMTLPSNRAARGDRHCTERNEHLATHSVHVALA